MRRLRFRALRVAGASVVSIMAVIAVGVVAWAGYGVWQLDRNVGRVEINRDVAAGQTTTTTTTMYDGPTQPVTFLLLGNDTRTGANEAYIDKKASRSGQGGGGADSIILVRVDPVAKRTQMISIHRDLRVRIPGHGTGKINSTLAYGDRGNPGGVPDPSLTVQVVEQITGVHVDHVGIIDFAGFESVVDAVGGVELCLEYAEKDAYTGLNLPAGCTNATGSQALAYARSRHGKLEKPNAKGDLRWVCDCTDDYGRIKRQQAFLQALARKLASPSQLRNLPGIAAALKGNVWVDDELDLNSTVALGRHMAGNLDNIATASVPVTNSSIGGVSYVELIDDAAEELFEEFRAGTMQSRTIEPGGGSVVTTAPPTTVPPTGVPAPASTAPPSPVFAGRQ